MELLLILVVGGMAAWLMRPLRDWYVLDMQDSSGTGLEKSAFANLDTAQQAFQRAAEKGTQTGAPRVIHLWHVEARSRRQALSGKLPAGKQPDLVRSDRISI